MPICELSGKKPLTKNKISHSNIKTKSRTLPNVQIKKFYSQSLKKHFRLKVAAATIRSIDKYGGFDYFLIRTKDINLTPPALKLKRQLQKIAQSSKKGKTNEIKKR